MVICTIGATNRNWLTISTEGANIDIETTSVAVVRTVRYAVCKTDVTNANFPVINFSPPKL